MFQSTLEASDNHATIHKTKPSDMWISKGVRATSLDMKRFQKVLLKTIKTPFKDRPIISIEAMAGYGKTVFAHTLMDDFNAWLICPSDEAGLITGRCTSGFLKNIDLTDCPMIVLDDMHKSVTQEDLNDFRLRASELDIVVVVGQQPLPMHHQQNDNKHIRHFSLNWKASSFQKVMKLLLGK